MLNITMILLKDVLAGSWDQLETFETVSGGRDCMVVTYFDHDTDELREFRIFIVGANECRNSIAHHLFNLENESELDFYLTSAIECGIFRDGFDKIVIHNKAS